MIALAALAAAAIFALLVVIVVLQRSHREARAQWALELKGLEERDARVVASLLEFREKAEAAWREERRELLNRVQAPSQIPTRIVEGFETPEDEPDEAAQVGTVQFDESYAEHDFHDYSMYEG